MHWFSVTNLEQNAWHKTNQQQKKTATRRQNKSSQMRKRLELFNPSLSRKKFQNDNRLYLSQQNFKHLATIRTTTK